MVNRLDVAATGCGQRGSASIEFVLLFPAMFLILYAIVTYGLIFGAQHSMALAAAEGGRAALRYQAAANPMAACEGRRAAAEATASDHVTWLRNIAGEALTTQATVSGCDDAASSLIRVTVSVSYAYAQAPLIPRLLPTPEAPIGSSAVVELSRMQLL